MNKKAIAILAAIFYLSWELWVFNLFQGFIRRRGKTSVSEENPADNNPSEASGNSGGNNSTTTPAGSASEKFVKLTSSEQIVSPILFITAMV